MSTSWRCVLVGSESLLIECAAILEQRGHRIAGVLTSGPTVQRWAARHGVRAFADTASLLAAGDLGEIDYLFSITHLFVLPDEVLALPKRAAINFHDGPLPQYAGLNTPVWAILNGEAEHGITWHRMTRQVDAGDILAERRFTLAPDETALTLNTRCFEAGLDSFGELIDGLASGALSSRPQGSAPHRVYRRKDRPAAACSIDWTCDAQAVLTLIRALDHGSYGNPIGAAKLVIAGQPFVVTSARSLGRRSGSAAGTIVSIGPEGIAIATASEDVLIERIETPQGQTLPVEQLAARHGLSVGGRVDSPDAALRERLGQRDADLGAHEPFWRQRLEDRTPGEIPTIDRTKAPVAPRVMHQDMALPAGADLPAVAAGLALLLTRLNDKPVFDLGFADAGLERAQCGLEAWFATQLPLRMSVDLHRGFDHLRTTTVAGIDQIRRHRGLALDLIGRTPTLRGAARTADLARLPVAVREVESLGAPSLPAGVELDVAVAAGQHVLRWTFDAELLPPEVIRDLQVQFETLVHAALTDGRRALRDLPLLPQDAVRRLLEQAQGPQAQARTDACVHRLIEEQAARTPDRIAVTCRGQSLTYAELDRRANRLARRLATLGVGPDVLVGVAAERSVELVVALQGIHKAGGAYVPIDPGYPRDRVAYMIDDSKVALLLTQQRLLDELPPHAAKTICLDSDWPSIERESDQPFDGGARPQHLAYVIYTSGSTGKPKGVMVEHRNVVNFFAGMDVHLGADAPGTWLAVTSLSFDISVLELFWTLARGYSVVLSVDDPRSAATVKRGAHAARPLDFSLFYFSADESEGGNDKYRLLLEGAKYADRHGFSAVWTPERHFHAFGGLYPNPAVTGAAVAAITERVQIRAGSVVLPLHHPARIAEEWSVVDNISKGRVGISFASGWQPNDFVLKPENYADNKNVMLRGIETVRALWRGESRPFPGPLGKDVDTRILPRPVQAELPFWVTSAGNPETFIAAGRLGARVLTHLLGQTVEELADKLAAYRRAWKEAGHAGEGYVSLMLHTFVGPDDAQVRAKVRQPLIEYLRTSLNLVKQYAWSFPAFKRREGMESSAASIDLQSLDAEEMTALLEHSFERYYETSGLFGTPESCLAMVDAIKAIGVDDVACLIDFGVDSASVLEHLPYLNQLRKASTPAPQDDAQDQSLPALLARHQVTHLQCTPSMARMLASDEAAARSMAGLKRMLVGGEAFPPTLARELKSIVGGEVMNMYGPTETTIWSATHIVDAAEPAVPLGRPLANQEIHILDSRQQLLPAGVPGELVIGGAGVVRGYLHRPELTAERFLVHPFRGEEGGRIYRTGDLARRRADGVLEFLGRLDHQVKVRGYRIELGEIESALLEGQGLREAVVLAREDSPGDVRLVAYVVASAQPAPAEADLRDRLRARLPEFMVPSHIVFLDALPQTPNGKVDRKALPAPDSAKPAAPVEAFVAPGSELEKTIAAIWVEVLKLPQVGTRDNFFDLGGHSLLAVQAHRRLREALGRSLSITDIFRFPTVQSLAGYLGAGDSGAVVRQGQDRAAGRRAALQRRQAQRVGADH